MTTFDKDMIEFEVINEAPEQIIQIWCNRDGRLGWSSNKMPPLVVAEVLTNITQNILERYING
jgi:hypothetical protein